MLIRKATLPALALVAALAGTAGIAALGTRDADAQATTAAPQRQAGPEHRFDPSRHIEGRIAFLKAELKITDTQAPLFERVAQAMRDNAKEMGQLREQRLTERDKPKSAIESLEGRARFGELRTQQTQRFLAAFKPLYDGLSDQQKQTADELLAGHRHHHHHRG
jgi:ABC-type sugar transport system substrate-binding protein